MVRRRNLKFWRQIRAEDPRCEGHEHISGVRSQEPGDHPTEQAWREEDQGRRLRVLQGYEVRDRLGRTKRAPGKQKENPKFRAQGDT